MSNLRAFFREIRRRVAGQREDAGLTFVWEPRGEWKSEEVRELCEELDLVHGVYPLAQPPATRGLGYFRLHGRTGYRYKYTDRDLRELLKLAGSLRPCYVHFNNISILEDVRRFQQLAYKRAGD